MPNHHTVMAYGIMEVKLHTSSLQHWMEVSGLLYASSHLHLRRDPMVLGVYVSESLY